jgi:transcriptional regulator with GAF, ATPase, and Fis domain
VPDLIGSSRVVRELREAVTRVARSEATLLLTGETGSGKGLVARRVHELSARRDGPFVHVDCASLSPTVIESELFGHERGAFTDAVSRRAGRLERASGGTLFLDEIGDLAPALQAKLLRVLQDREFERVGGSRTLRLDARVIAATHRDLPARVRRGAFRADLFYRLDVLGVAVPPLRERKGDLPELARDALARIARRNGQAPLELCAEALHRLALHAWPGNVRELLNVLERCAILATGRRVTARDVERALARPAVAVAEEPVEDPPEREAIADALLATGGNVRRTARRLGVARSTLRYRILRHGLEHLLPRD